MRACAGAEGDLVFTTITKEGFPLIRYRTGDITLLDPAPCPCGRTFARMARVTGRTDDLILFHGVGFFPSEIGEILAEVEGTSPHYQIILDREGGVDTLEIKVGVSEDIPSLDEMKVLEALRRQIAGRVKAALDLERPGWPWSSRSRCAGLSAGKGASWTGGPDRSSCGLFSRSLAVPLIENRRKRERVLLR